MQITLQWEKGFAEYQSSKNLPIKKFEKCVHCGCGKFYKWGKYKRYVIEEDKEYQISVRRIRCVKCGKTYSYLPSQCVSGICYSLNYIMKLLSVLLLKIKKDLGDLKRRAYAFLKRFKECETRFAVFLRAVGFKDFPENPKERSVKIFRALMELSNTLSARFFEVTGTHFMRAK